MECATIRYDKPHFFPMHLHPDRYTFSYVFAGGAQLVSNDRLYMLEQGDLVVIPPYVAHQTWIEHLFHYMVIRFPMPHALLSLDCGKKGITIIKNNNSYNDEYFKWFEEIKTNLTDRSNMPKLFQPFLAQEVAHLTPHKTFLKKALVHLEHNFHRRIPLEELSDITHLSESHFHRVFKSYIGISPTRYLQNLRIEKAKELIKVRNAFTSIAYDTGFFDQSHFNKCFKTNVGMIPKRYADLVKK